MKKPPPCRQRQFATGRLLLLITAAIGLSACSAGQSARNLEASSPPEGYREKVASHVRETFFDPYSVRDAAAAISAPLRKTGSMYWSLFDPKADWYVCLRANAKNRMGGYTGREENIYLFRNGQIIGTHTKPTGAGFESSTTDKLCADARYEPFPEIEGKAS